ncbi:MAG: ornithine cyclodeaminase [Bacteroidales bacterium]|nr:ornithine cyclodeaminase [Bacteroidales bacterium]
MKIITKQQIKDLQILPSTCVDWVREGFSIKDNSQVPAKISVHPKGSDYFTTMPCLLPLTYNRVGLKIIRRISGNIPSICSEILLYESSTGTLLAIIDGDWITAMRTGATAVVAAQELRCGDNVTYGFIGLGNMARSTLLCLLESERNIHHRVILLNYKDQVQSFVERFRRYDNVTFDVAYNIEDVVEGSAVIVSSITDADGLLCERIEKFRPGCTLIPIHVRGFENCDTAFDKVIGDDTEHLKNWKHFNEFKHFSELKDVIGGRIGRCNERERILVYNYGLALHDTFFASKIYEMFNTDLLDVEWPKETNKFWV